jgi:hypothetical protein
MTERLTMALTTAFKPGQSPPPVRIPNRINHAHIGETPRPALEMSRFQAKQTKQVYRHCQLHSHVIDFGPSLSGPKSTENVTD